MAETLKEKTAKGLFWGAMNNGAMQVIGLVFGMSVQNHKASLKERFEVMRSNYGIVTTVLVHTWFVVRSLFKR